MLTGQELHRRIIALEEALKATSASHPLLSKSTRSTSISSDTGLGPTGSLDQRQPERAGDGAADSLSGYSHLVVEEDPGRSRYYGAASSVYLTVRSYSTISSVANG
jgi:hypothetical protein